MAQAPDPHALGPAVRAGALDRLDDELFDIVVIGGGVTGCGVALDAATRGFSVALIEQRDFASGTSSRSSKLIHGGLRYLEQLEFPLVFEALRERGLMVSTLAPHLVRPVSFLYPLTHRVWERGYVGAGVALYDLMAAASRTNVLPRHRHLSKRRALELMPALEPSTLVGGVRYWDAQVDDARHTLTVARTAAVHGAVMATSVRATGLLRTGRRVIGVATRCLETGRDLAIRSGCVVNATGVWSDQIEEMAGEHRRQVTASKGVHLVVPRSRIRSETGMIIRTETSVLFVVPWHDFWIIGTTDTPWTLGLAHPAASSRDIDVILDHVNGVLAEPLTRDDVVGVYAGLRPLLAGETDATSKLSREHSVAVRAPGLVTIAGGKYTTYRVMAEDTVDVAAKQFTIDPPASRTRETPLYGAEGHEDVRRDASQLATVAAIDVAAVERLVGRYGAGTRKLVAAMASDPSLARPVAGAPGYLRAEIRHAATDEAALHLDDVLTRRTRISIETADRGLAAAEDAVRIMQSILAWDEATVARELDHYRARVHAEVQSQLMPDDHTADAARMGAPDVRTGA
jgi:glycerol-3-phosphate dehydrogenase